VGEEFFVDKAPRGTATILAAGEPIGVVVQGSISSLKVMAGPLL